MAARTRITKGPEETKNVGRELAATLKSGDILLLTGDLGAGKTTFVQGIAEGLGADVAVTSPSFVIVNEYAIGVREQESGNSKSRRYPDPSSLSPVPSILRHLDLYRLEDLAIDIDRIGLPELLNDPAAITVIEWAERLPKTINISQNVIQVKMEHGEKEGERKITVSA